MRNFNATYLVTIFLVALKTLGGFAFSWFLIYTLGDKLHVKILKDLSAIIGISLFIRFGADAVILKLATKLYVEKNKTYLNYLLCFSFIICMVNSIVTLLFVDKFIKFETLEVKSAIFIALAISLTFCLMSFLKAFKRVNHSFFGDTGMIMVLSFPFLFINNGNVIVTLGYIWLFVMAISLFLILRIIKNECKENSVNDFSTLLFNFIMPLPNLFLNSVLNYLQQWGIIYLSALSLNVIYASSFILIIRASYIFNAVLSPLASYTVPEVIRLFDCGGAHKANIYIKKTKELYQYASFICLVISSAFSIWSIYPNLVDFYYISAFMIFLFCCSFSVASGPVNMYMAVLGYEKLLIKIRLALLIPFVILLYCTSGNLFILVCSIYIFSQRFFLVVFLKKKTGIIAL
ncbi:hypothetical protein [Vibrio furnissii]|uniref:hypothetical protein n=1 Tax=Vibrio furnissii TaxID=29494 RepID=UPI00117CF9A0|nr:hypothetical protein [Vibrio furnissii]